jgi:DNA-binding MarR family transcriptional regulator
MPGDGKPDPLAVANELRSVLVSLIRELRHETERFGVTDRQVTLLRYIRNHSALTFRELAAKDGISGPALSGHIDRLEIAGLVVRTRDESDRRRVRLAVTEEGARLLRRVQARRTSWLTDRLSQLEPEELNAVYAALQPLGRLS